MKNLMIAAAVAAALAQLPAAAHAASSDDLAQIREQLQGLMQRVDKLEQENQTLKSENQDLKTQSEDLKAQGDYLKAETRGLRKENAQQSADADKVKGTDWACEGHYYGRRALSLRRHQRRHVERCPARRCDHRRPLSRSHSRASRGDG